MKNGRVIINRNICDNAKECSGIDVCPTGALYWDDTEEEISYNATACIDCGTCADSCPVEAILWGCDDADYETKLKEVEEDTRKTADLEIERYGASPIDSYIEYSELNTFLDAVKTKYVLLELFEDASINCLLHSIRVSEIVALFEKDEVVYKKVYLNNVSDCKICETGQFPALVIIKDARISGAIVGYYDDDIDNKMLFFNKIKELK